MGAPRTKGGGLPAAVFRSVVPDSVRPRVTALYRPLRYRGNQVECPICQGTFDRFMDHRGQPRVRCPRCGSMERHRLLWLYFTRETDLLTAPHRLLHFAPEWTFLRHFRRTRSLDYVTADLESGLAEEHFDITRNPHPDDSFDVVLCNHVLEHVPDDRAAMREIARVLRPGGWAVVMVPVARGRAATEEDSTLTDRDERLRRWGQEDHVRLYGADYVDRLHESGLDVEVRQLLSDLDDATIVRHGLRRTDDIFEADAIYLARPAVPAGRVS